MKRKIRHNTEIGFSVYTVGYLKSALRSPIRDEFISCPILNPFNIREKVEICERKDDEKSAKCRWRKCRKRCQQKNPAKHKQFSRVTASPDSYGIVKSGCHCQKWTRTDIRKTLFVYFILCCMESLVSICQNKQQNNKEKREKRKRIMKLFGARVKSFQIFPPLINMKHFREENFGQSS